MEDTSSPSIVFRKIAVSGERFDKQYALRRCREFLAENNDKKLIRYTLVPDEKAATIGWVGCDHCKAYPFWRMQYDAVAKESFPIGEMLVFNGNAVLRYRDRNGAVTETVLQGSNPLPVTIGAFKGNIVQVGMQGRMPRPWLELYIVGTGEMTSEAGADYIAKFAQEMGVQDSSVQFRADPWFINEIWRTWFPLFEERRGNPPSEKDFDATKTPGCTVVRTIYNKITNNCTWKGVERLP